jgi:hypothetical protein
VAKLNQLCTRYERGRVMCFGVDYHRVGGGGVLGQIELCVCGIKGVDQG